MLTDLEKNAIRDHYQNIGKNLPGFRPRASQREMIAAIANAFSRTLTREEGEEAPKREGESIAVIEGPTGVGKSLAYLLAGGIMAQTRGKWLIVSSATVALQEQLVDRDLPFLVEKSGLELTFALAKGRGRYLCPYKLYQLTQNNAQQNLLGFEAPEVLWDSKPKPEELNLLRDIADEFSARRFNGDRDTWPEKIDDTIWLKVTNDRHGCLKSACPNRPECPFYLARDVLETVDVVVANHDLLLADISMGGGVILPAPENSFYCIDEAHHLSKKALSRFAAEHSWNIAVWTLEKLPQLTGKIAALTDKAELANLADEAATSLLDSLHEWQFHLAEEPSLSLGSSENDRRKHNEPTWLWEDGKIPEGLETTVSNTAIAARSLLKHVIGLNDALSAARREKEQDGALLDRLTSEFGLFIARIEQISAVWDLLSTVPIEGEEPLAKWITRRADDKNDYIFNASPISSASHLANSLWRHAAGAVLTSATLQSLGSFNLICAKQAYYGCPKPPRLHWKARLISIRKASCIFRRFKPAPKTLMRIRPPLSNGCRSWFRRLKPSVRWCCFPRASKCRMSPYDCLTNTYRFCLCRASCPRPFFYKGTIKLLPKVKPALFSASTVLPKASTCPVRPACKSLLPSCRLRCRTIPSRKPKTVGLNNAAAILLSKLRCPKPASN